MPANRVLPRRTTSRKSRPTGRPVTEVLLELAYQLHTTRVVARPGSRQQA